MKYSRGLIFNIVVPIAAMLAIGGAIFGGQAISEARVSGNVQHALSAELATAALVEVKYLQEVNHGYGICGLYRVASADQGYASFFYDKINDRVTLDVNSPRFKSNCGLSAIC
ncbi:hypothetical protein [Halomonas huangheensis]|uniref:Uncharacterized protein n=1 Tax=Halomonas huangheensis TaxID=1178482 RepID=W1NCY6_9GAMM|nr:hypothetical protein [Halomonas huangheensis]ALM52977.1 hypothetical protein AR456_12285 [Halomonas huangheensis]ERL53096.1 hypothetical protein BJB45_17625 [Halomonas huangheensis]